MLPKVGRRPPHLSAAMTELIAARDWLTVRQLPPYTHELNPVELVCHTSSAPWLTSPSATSPS
jgi:transposase